MSENLALNLTATAERHGARTAVRLDAAARKIADGDLSVRAKPRYGPPELRRMAATFNMMAGRLEACGRRDERNRRWTWCNVPLTA